MTSKYGESQLKLLKLLIKKYEDSSNYLNPDARMNKKYVSPENVMDNYNDDYADLDMVDAFVSDMKELEDEGIISIEFKNGIISKLIANPLMWNRMYEITGVNSKRDILLQQKCFFENLSDDIPVTSRIKMESLEKINSGKIINDFDRIKTIIYLCEKIVTNKQDMFEREFSILYCSDSKLFVDSYKESVCNEILKTYDMSDVIYGLNYKDRKDKTEIQHIILKEFGIFSNPDYVYFKGNVEIRFQDGSFIRLNNSTPFAVLLNSALDNIVVHDEKVMTIENLTAFNRFNKSGYTAVFTGGYHGRRVREFLKNLCHFNPGKQWFHFGDIDPDGFYILEHLVRSTGICFFPYRMGVTELVNFKRFTKKLENNDVIKGRNLLKEGKYGDVITYMLDNNMKLEQEIFGVYE